MRDLWNSSNTLFIIKRQLLHENFNLILLGWGFKLCINTISYKGENSFEAKEGKCRTLKRKSVPKKTKKQKTNPK